MMMKTNPITPPPELVAKWASSMCGYYEAAQWGANQELEACCEWLFINGYNNNHITSTQLHAARRPKPPSRKEQALEAIGRLCASVIHDDLKNDAAIVRRALEALDD